MHEAKMHRYNSFVTLTYKPEKLPEHGQLVKRDVTRFLKRTLRALVKGRGQFLCATTTATIGRSHGATPHTPATPTFRYYYAGEYGEQFHRPHFHICMFGLDFADKIYLARTPTKNRLYRSPTLEKLWTDGFSSIGEVNFETAAYVARYVMKKITGNRKEKHYERTDAETGEIYQLQPEYNQMSRRPGIGKPWLDKFKTDVYPEGKVIVRGKQTNSPRYYDKLYAKMEPLQYEDLQYGRYVEGLLHVADQTPARLAARERVTEAKLSMLKRKI